MSESEESPPAADAPETDAGDRSFVGIDDLPDGSGCAEIWDYLSERRRRQD